MLETRDSCEPINGATIFDMTTTLAPDPAQSGRFSVNLDEAMRQGRSITDLTVTLSQSSKPVVITDPDGRVLAESFHTRWTAGPDQLSAKLQG